MIVVLSLKTKYEIISFSLVSLGILNEALWHAREAFRPAIVQNAKAVVMMHNHPSGDPSPSFGDCAVTAKAHSAGALLDMPLLDHVIIGKGSSFYSFKAAGELDDDRATMSAPRRSKQGKGRQPAIARKK